MTAGTAEILSYRHGPGGSHPAAWGYRPGQHARQVLMPATLTPVTLATSWAAVDTVLCSDAAPGGGIPMIGHSERVPDFNTLPAGGLHKRIRAIVGPALQVDGDRIRAQAAALARRLDLREDQPADLKESLCVPATQALAAALGFPASEWRSSVMAPTARMQDLIKTIEVLREVRATLGDLLGYCRELDSDLRRRGDDSPLARIAATMRAQGMPDETVWHTFRTLATGSVTPAAVLPVFFRKLIGTPGLATAFWRVPDSRGRIVSEIMRTSCHFGLMNPRLLRQPLRLADGFELPAGPVIPSMHAALHDPAQFPHPELFDPGRPVSAAAWGWGPHGCSAYRPGRALLQGATEAFTRVCDSYPGGVCIASEPTVHDGLLPCPDTLMVCLRPGFDQHPGGPTCQAPHPSRHRRGSGRLASGPRVGQG